MRGLTIMVKPVSSSCNMRCRYCFYENVAASRTEPSMGVMDTDTLEVLVRRAMHYADGPVSFAFQGGEPTLAGTQFYEKLIAFQKRYNSRNLPIQNAIQTNGYHLDDDLAALLAKERFLVGVSLDGTAQTHDLLRRDAQGRPTSGAVTATIAKLRRLHIDFNILCVVNRYVAERPKETFRALRQYGYIQYIPCLDPFDGTQSDYSLTEELYTQFLKKSFDLYAQEMENGRFVSIRNFDNYLAIIAGRQSENCAMGGRCARYYLIEANGNVYPCDFYVLDQWCMGNIRSDSFFRLEKSPVAAKFTADSLYVSPECRQCRWYSLCRGGCRREREPFTEGLPALNKWCRCYQQLFQYAYPRMKKLAGRLFH